MLSLALVFFYCLFVANDDVCMFLFLLTRKPAVIMIVGVNGGGKTTSLGKIRLKTQAHNLQFEGLSILCICFGYVAIILVMLIHFPHPAPTF